MQRKKVLSLTQILDGVYPTVREAIERLAQLKQEGYPKH